MPDSQDKDETKKRGLRSMFEKGFRDVFDGLRTKIEEPDLVGRIIASEPVQSRGAEAVRRESENTLNDVRNHAGSIVREQVDRLNPKQVSTYKAIRDSIANPNDGIFAKIGKNIFARILHVGAKITSFVTVGLINHVLEPKDKVESEDVEGVLAGMMSKLFGKKPQPAQAAG